MLQRRSRFLYVSLYTADSQLNPVLLTTEPLTGSVFMWTTNTPTMVYGVEVRDGNGKLYYQQWGMTHYMQSGDFIKFQFAFA
jgi:hypothetical protein